MPAKKQEDNSAFKPHQSVFHVSHRKKSFPIGQACSIVMTTFLCGHIASANVTGSDAQNFNPTTSGLDFVTVQSSETLAQGIFNLGLFVNHAKNSFPYYDAGTNAAPSERNNSLLGGDFNFGLGLLENWDVGVSFPFILKQSVDNAEWTGHYSSTGNTEIRINTKYRMLGDEAHGLAIVASSNFNRIKNNPFLGQDGGPIYNLELAADYSFQHIAAALNVGYRWRNPGARIENSGVEPIPNQWLASGALSYLIESLDTKVIFEVLSAFPEDGKLTGATDREYSVLEALLGLKHDQGSHFSYHFGVGGGLANGMSSPDYRVYAGVNLTFGPWFGTNPSTRDPYANGLSTKLTQLPPLPENSEVVEESADQNSKTEVAEASSDTDTQKTATSQENENANSVARSGSTATPVPVFNRGQYNHIVLNSLEFKGQTLTLTPESAKYLRNELVGTLRELHRRRPIGVIVIEGHTDSVGSADRKKKLSLERARAVGLLLRKSLGIRIPIRIAGLGDSSPIADNGNYQGRAMNRRVEFKLLYRRSTK